NFKNISQIDKIPADQQRAIEVVGSVLPFKVNNYVLDELIDWDNLESDPIYHLTIPQKDMLLPEHYARVEEVLSHTDDKASHREVIHDIRMQLNPHPAGQQKHNVPIINNTRLTGVQHKYRETVLFFPSSGQTCHSYCTFCFRWPQFVGMDELKFAMRETELLV